MATYTKYNTAIEKLCNKLIDAFGTTDTWKAVIHTDAPTTTTDSVVSDLTQIAGNNGYTTGGADITFNSTRTNHDGNGDGY
jgi:phage gp45-like